MTYVPQLLLVDDNPADIDLARDVLARSQYPVAVCVVSDGEQAMAFLHGQGVYRGRFAPDLILLDLNLPRKDGRLVLAEVKADPMLCKTPIIVFSTSQAQHDVTRSYELGANGYVCKPNNLADYVAAVDAIGEFWFGCVEFPQTEER
jgi:chemotaxis family two-component system response regulator Rcp1